MPDWYYLSKNIWELFDSTISNELETLFQKGSATGKFDDFLVDFHSMSLKRERKRNRIQIKRGDMNANPSFAWEWEMNGKWHSYDFFDSDFLCSVENKPHIGTTVLYLGPDNTPYEIDTKSLFQKNLKTSYRRSIRKVPIALPPPVSTAAPAPAVNTATNTNNNHNNIASTTTTTTITTISTTTSTPTVASALNNNTNNTNNTNDIKVSATTTTSNTPPGLDLNGVPSDIRTIIFGCNRMNCNEDCVICMEPFDDINGVAWSLPQCLNHGFHLECIKNLLISQGKCPICNKIYVINDGIQPKNGTMSVRTHPRGSLSLPGYTRCGTIEM